LNNELERRKARQMKAVVAAMKIAQMQGGLDVTENMQHIRIAALGSLAETRGLWQFLIDRGMATEKQRQDYLDKGYDQMLAQIDSAAGAVMLQTPGH
jgi:hypothetical protein